MILSNGLVMKDDLTVGDILAVFRLYSDAVHEERVALQHRKRWKKYFHHMSRSNEYLKMILNRLTNTRIKNKHLKVLYEAVNKAGMLNEKNAEQEGKLEEFEDSIAWLSARINKAPAEVRDSMTSKDVHRIAKEVMKRDIEKSVAIMKSYHMPKEYMKEIKTVLSNIKHNIGKPKKTETMDTFGMLRRACFQPH